MRPRTIVLTSVALSVLASAITATLLAPRGDRAPRAATASQTASPAVTLPPATPTAEPTTDASLAERVHRIEARLDAAGVVAAPRSTKEAIDALLAITQGERQVAIEDSFHELVAMGDDVVPEIVALLRSGRDQDWGGGFSYSGNMVRGYPRLRTLLIDVLRQIGTPTALNGLLDGLRGTQDPTDFRDLFLFFRTTTDETMVRGISEMTPAALRVLKDADEKQAYMLLYGVTDWIQQHEFPNKLDLVEELARQGLDSNRMDRGSFALLISLSPERAFALLQEVREKQGDQALRTAVGGLSSAQNLPCAKTVRFAEMCLASGIGENERFTLYASLPWRPCSAIKEPEARVADARLLLDFLKRRLGEETGDNVKVILTQRIGSLESSLR
jgi:hypothetical protein